MATNTTENVAQTHQHSFSAQGLCSCGKTFDQWRAEHEGQAPAAKTEETEEENK